MAALEDEQYRKGAGYYKDVQEQFRRALNSIQMDIERWYMRLAENNGISYAAAKRLLKKGELEAFKWDVQQYIKAGEENAIDRRWMKELENASARHHISYLEAMKLQVQQHAELLSTEFEGGMTDFLHKSYADSYYHTAYEMAKGTGIGTNLARLDDKRIDAVIKRPWAQDGASFSDRIWTNRQKLVNSLHTELTQNIMRGESPQKAIDSLARTMDVSRAQAGRLIMTESAAIASAAQKDTLKELGVEQYEILATLDGNTSEICREMDGKVFDMKDYEVGVTAPPFHPNCRSSTVPYFDDEFTDGEERAARNEETGETYYVPANMKYREWEKEFVKSRTFEQQKSAERNAISSVNWEIINSKEYRDKFKQVSDNEKVQETLHSKSIDVLRHRSGTDFEDFYLIDQKTGSVVASQTKVEYTEGISEELKHNRVWYNKEVTKAIRRNPEKSFITIHNHANNKPPSGGDFDGAFKNGYYAGLNICHDGTIYYYQVGKRQFSGRLYDATVEKYRNRGYNEIEAYEKALNQFAESYGIKWRKL